MRNASNCFVIFVGACVQDDVTLRTMWSMFQACTEPDPENPQRPFSAGAIIASPRAFGAVCCAERLQVQLPVHSCLLCCAGPLVGM